MRLGEDAVPESGVLCVFLRWVDDGWSSPADDRCLRPDAAMFSVDALPSHTMKFDRLIGIDENLPRFIVIFHDAHVLKLLVGVVGHEAQEGHASVFPCGVHA